MKGMKFPGMGGMGNMQGMLQKVQKMQADRKCRRNCRPALLKAHPAAAP